MDRFDYSSAIADSWKQQTLLNIVKMRYMDLPVFVDVSSIVAGYSIQSGITVNGTLSSQNAVQGNYASLGGQVVFTDRPTITYVPMTGEKFLRGLVTPIDPKHIFFMLQAGYPADFLLGMTVESLNGLRNRSSGSDGVREADADFARALELLREIQVAGGIGLRVEEDKSKTQTTVVFFRNDATLSATTLAKTEELRRLLRLSSTENRFLLTYSPLHGADHELAVSSRSMLQILAAFAGYVEVPESHLKEHGLIAMNTTDQKPAIRVRSSHEKPLDAFCAVQYRGHWFWIANEDWQTKRALTAVVFFFTLAETGDAGKLPMVTIPAQ
jgi:hypothetical protein